MALVAVYLAYAKLLVHLCIVQVQYRLSSPSTRQLLLSRHLKGNLCWYLTMHIASLILRAHIHDEMYTRFVSFINTHCRNFHTQWTVASPIHPVQYSWLGIRKKMVVERIWNSFNLKLCRKKYANYWSIIASECNLYPWNEACSNIARCMYMVLEYSSFCN